MEIVRCPWAKSSDDLYLRYHDEEWGVPQTNDAQLFEHLVLETAQAGLSWRTVLSKRDAYRSAFAQFDPRKIAGFSAHDVERLMQNEGIIRNRLKILATITNARKFLEVQKEYGTFTAYQWQFIGGHPRQNTWQDISEVPAVTPESIEFSADLKRRGFSFVGPTTVYAHMQATGMVNDHVVSCFRYEQVRLLDSMK